MCLVYHYLPSERRSTQPTGLKSLGFTGFLFDIAGMAGFNLLLFLRVFCGMGSTQPTGMALKFFDGEMGCVDTIPKM